MAEPEPAFKNPFFYSPGQFAFQNNPEMSQIISQLGGPIMQGLGGAGTFLPHMMQSQHVMDQYTVRQYQNQTRASTFAMDGAGNQNVSNLLLGMRSLSTDEPASELNKSQAEQFAGLINSPTTKAVLGMIMGPENLEATLHGRKGDVAGLNQVANRIGFFRNDPSGDRRMDANSLEDFSRGMYAHLYDEGGNLSGLEREGRAAGAQTAKYSAGVELLGNSAKMQAGTTMVSDDEVKKRVTQRMDTGVLREADVNAAYKEHVPGGIEKDSTKQIDALAKLEAAIQALNKTAIANSGDKASGFLGEKEVTVAALAEQANKKTLDDFSGLDRDIRAVRAGSGDAEYAAGIQGLKKAANIEADTTVVSADDVKDRITKSFTAKQLSDKDVTAAYTKHVPGGIEKDSTKQIDALAKLEAAIQDLNKTVKSRSSDKASGFLKEKEVTVPALADRARKNTQGSALDEVKSNVDRVMRAGSSAAEYDAGIQDLKKAANIAADTTVVSNDDVKNRVTKSIEGNQLSEADVNAAYKTHFPKGSDTTLDKKIEKLATFDPAVQDLNKKAVAGFGTGAAVLKENEVTVATLADRANKNTLTGNIADAARDVRAGSDTTFDKQDSVQRLKKFADIDANTTVVSADEVKNRVTDSIKKEQLKATDIDELYKKYVLGDETDTARQIEKLATYDPAVQEINKKAVAGFGTGAAVLKDNEVTFDKLTTQAHNNRLNEVHGFMAGQVGQITEQMFQQGMLPQAVGAMSPADRVKLLSEEGRLRDPETMTRLAQEFGHRDMMAKDKEYAKEADPLRKSEMLNSRLDVYRGTLNNVFTEIDARNANPKNPQTSIAQIERLPGYSEILSNVDAKRTAAAVKDRTGAVAAVREIFAANGKTNVQTPMLLAALEHLSQGASSQMEPKKLEMAMRTMQQVAMESGIGFEQMAGMAAQMGATGSMLGISKAQTIHNQINTMAMVKTMRDEGVFSKPVFGGMNQAEALQLTGQKMQAGEASQNSKVMAALAGIYTTSPGEFKADTEFAKAMEAYNNPSSEGKYTFEGKEKNIFEIVGRDGPQALQEMAKTAGVSNSRISAAIMNPGSQQFAKAGAGFQTQRFELLRNIENAAVNGALTSQLDTAIQENAAGPELKKLGADKAAAATDGALSALILDTAGLNQEEQIAEMGRQMVPTLTKAFIDSGKTEPEATALATEMAATMNNGRVKELIDRTGGYVQSATGLSMAQARVPYGNGIGAKGAHAARQYEAIAARKAATGLNFSASNPLAAMSEYVADMGARKQKIKAEGMIDAALSVIPDQKLRDKYIEGALPGLNSMQEELNKIEVTEPYIQELIDSKEKGGQAKTPERLKEDEAKLKKLAKVGDKFEVITDEAFKTQLDTKMTDALITTEQTKTAYASVFGADSANLTPEQQRDALMTSEKFKAEKKDALTKELAKGSKISRAQLKADSSLYGLGTLQPQGEGESTEAFEARRTDHENQKTMRAGVLTGGNADAVDAGIDAAIAHFNINADENSKKELKTLIGKYDPLDEKKDAEHKKALENKITALAADGGLLSPVEKGLNPEKRKALNDERTTEAIKYGETQRQGGAIDINGTLGSINQKIDNARIEATTVALHYENKAGAPAVAGADADAGKPAAGDKEAKAKPTFLDSFLGLFGLGAPSPAVDSTAAESEKPLKNTLPGQQTVAAPPDKQYDVDPKDFTDSGSKEKGSYLSIGEGKFRDRKGWPIKRPTEGSYFDAMNVVDPKEVDAREQKDKKGRTGRVGQIGEKYYEEYKASGVADAWREITVGENKPGAQAATKDAPEGTPAEGKTATSASTDASKTEATPAATDTTAASAATSAAARAAAATEANSTVSPAGSSVTPSAGPAGGGMGGSGQQPTTLTGKLEITNLEAGVLEVMAKQDRPPTQVAGGAPIYAASAATMT